MRELHLFLKKGGLATDIKSYRPISNLPTLNKILEKILHRRLYSFLTDSNIISPTQFGFRKNKNTSQCTISLISNILPSFQNKNYSITVFIDNSKAFDTVEPDLLMEKLSRYGVRGVSHNLIKSYIQDREHYIFVNDTFSYTLKSNLGVAQGSCNGPLMYLTYANDLDKLLEDAHVVTYADDTAITISGPCLKTLESRMNKILQLHYDWSNYNKLTINKTKTKYILFGPRTPDIDIELKIGN